MNIEKMMEFISTNPDCYNGRGMIENNNYWDKVEQVKSLLQQGEKCRQKVDTLISQNPYPEEIFTPIPKEDFIKIDDLLKKELGYPLDRLSGNIGRKLYNSIIETLKEDKL